MDHKAKSTYNMKRAGENKEKEIVYSCTRGTSFLPLAYFEYCRHDLHTSVLSVSSALMQTGKLISDINGTGIGLRRIHLKF